MNATGSVPILVLAGPCTGRDDDQPHAWEPEDSADLVTYGEPDHGLSVSLGRCQHCGHALLAVDPLAADTLATGPWYEARGAEL